jgi:tripartite ATP-independent transporter DctP family solute receptor
MLRKYLLAVCAIGLLSLPPVEAAQLQIVLGHIGEPGSLWDISATEFAVRANAALGDEAKVTVYGASQLGDDMKLLEKLKTGEVTLSLPSTVMTTVHPCFGVFEMPFLIRNRDHVRAVRHALFKDAFRDFGKERGLFLLGMWENGFRQITNNERPIVQPGDLAGLRLRTPKGTWRIKMFNAYGVSAYPTGLEVVYGRLEDRTFDGQENPLGVIQTFKFYQVQKYLTISNHVYTPMFLVADNDKFSKLSERVRFILEKTALDLQDWILDKGRELDRQSLNRMEGHVAVNEIDPLAFILPSLKIYREFTEGAPQCKAIFKTIFSLTPRCDSLTCTSLELR